MDERIKLAEVDVPEVDRDRVGISYSGGGPLVLVELGCVRAFVECGIRPAAIVGVSAGARGAWRWDAGVRTSPFHLPSLSSSHRRCGVTGTLSTSMGRPAA